MVKLLLVKYKIAMTIIEELDGQFHSYEVAISHVTPMPAHYQMLKNMLIYIIANYLFLHTLWHAYFL